MLVGHFAVGFVGKRFDPTISLGTFVLAAMLADLLWCVFMMAGIETVRFKAGRGAANYYDAADVALSHSLLMDAIWGALFGAVYIMRQRGRSRLAWLLFGTVLSHWLLDFVSHKPDMPLAPGLPGRYGLGLWASIPATLLVEGGFWLVAIVFYARATSPRGRAGVLALWGGCVLLTLAWYNNIAGPPPPRPETAPIASLIFFSSAVAWAYWIGRLRPARA